MTACTHTLGGLACINTDPHPGDGRGCVHMSAWLADRHEEAADE